MCQLTVLGSTRVQSLGEVELLEMKQKHSYPGYAGVVYACCNKTKFNASMESAGNIIF
jgi:hypothetical protein